MDPRLQPPRRLTDLPPGLSAGTRRTAILSERRVFAQRQLVLRHALPFPFEKIGDGGPKSRVHDVVADHVRTGS
jgi:hypothetical protein